jgi:hypothetical protein
LAIAAWSFVLSFLDANLDRLRVAGSNVAASERSPDRSDSCSETIQCRFLVVNRARELEE